MLVRSQRTKPCSRDMETLKSEGNANSAYPLFLSFLFYFNAVLRLQSGASSSNKKLEKAFLHREGLPQEAHYLSCYKLPFCHPECLLSVCHCSGVRLVLEQYENATQGEQEPHDSSSHCSGGPFLLIGSGMKYSIIIKWSKILICS